MKYLAFAMKAEIMLIGLYMMYQNWAPFTGACLPGLAVFSIGLYLALQGYFGNSFSGCIFGSCDLNVPKKKGFFKK